MAGKARPTGLREGQEQGVAGGLGASLAIPQVRAGARPFASTTDAYSYCKGLGEYGARTSASFEIQTSKRYRE